MKLVTGPLAIALLAFAVGATPITFSTDSAGRGFDGASLTLTNSAGAEATLTFIAAVNSTTGVPSDVNFGNFTLVCETCTTQAIGTGSFCSAFTFNLVLTKMTDGAIGMFVGTSTGGGVFNDVSQVTINWAPLTLGPGTTNALTGNFGGTTFSTTVFTGIVAPNSGAVPGQSAVQGFVSSSDVPEPSTYALVGFVLVGVGVAHRRARSAGRNTRHTGRLANGPSRPALQPTAPRHLTARRHPSSLRPHCLQRFRVVFHLHRYLCRLPLQPEQRTGGKT
jgi:hypothetical protein